MCLHVCVYSKPHLYVTSYINVDTTVITYATNMRLTFYCQGDEDAPENELSQRSVVIHAITINIYSHCI